MYCRVIPFSQTFDSYGLTYALPDYLIQEELVGKIVEVPLKENNVLGICIELLSEEQLNFNHADIKDVIALRDDMRYLSDTQLQIIDYVATRYFCHIHHALDLYFPKNLKEKISKDTVGKIKLSEYEYKQTNITLSSGQQYVYDEIVRAEDILKFLIYGVTGSGKTQIYMKLIEDNLKKGKQTLLLIPEIILTSQIGDRVKQAFGEDVIILHSGVSAAKKAKYWMDIYHGNAKIIIGTRSSLYYPYNNLGAIIIDEEHDNSYISDSVPRYHTGDIACELSKLLNIPLVLGSGTPKVTTFYKGLKGEYKVLQLLEKYK